MKAVLVRELSPDLSGVELAEIAQPAGEVLVRVRAASLNYPDLLMTRGTYQFKPEPPFVSGLEMAGEVLEAPADSGFVPGDRVRGGAKIGAFAEYVALPAAALRKVPEAMDFAHAAAMGAAYHTAYVALVEIGGLEAGQTVLVHGASGGVGLAACDLARAMGAKVIAATHREDKLERLRAVAQPDAAILNTGRFREQVGELTGGRLCDLVFDPVGGDVFDESTRCVTFGGKLLVVGFVAGRIPEIAVNIPLIKGFSVVGVRAGEYARRFPERGARIAQAIDRLASEGRIAPHVERILPLASWREAFEAMANGEIIGKLVLEP
ncbi:MAG: NADPH:quinone oxidoreductase family protein [Erythrobacter sp.]|jgi:NADPH2:quinone reductase|uniref:NADPH:quinone oxidoreductase family protein n=1 Tax=Qipengyuania citrea TaxID=225971 RepID=UPI001A3BB523|nr:NADPH:quinone oxidoreductase family protein [Qipengyuania citrea]MBL4717230.1 NADPH:quinone oxidoreductase family protein [Erythrobacter sp.]MCP2016243.1 NADPH2:quinone reductase [Qipengyuania citrea]MDE0900311.1 NADPH:quinone oxidoreductase family protein [Erythrobacter sp.]